MSVKKVRLLDEEDAVEQSTDAPATSSASDNDAEKLMKFLEAIDWKLWEMLKIMRKQDESTDESS